MSKKNSKFKDDYQAVFLLSCFVGHPVSYKRGGGRRRKRRRYSMGKGGVRISRGGKRRVWERRGGG